LKHNHKDNSTEINNCDCIRIGISGGTFDPIHIGHLIAAEDIREKFRLDKVIFIPSGNPPHKDLKKVADSNVRFSMVQSAVSTNSHFEASRIEIDREGYTYTVDTLTELKNKYGDSAKLLFIIGADVVLDLLNWRSYERVFKFCEFIATLRPGYHRDKFDKEIKLLNERYGAVVHTVQAPLIEVSSTEVRERVSAGKSIKYLVPETVEEMIREQGLYK
jgi:nicotinate-nucleotide adenylyltransferase